MLQLDSDATFYKFSYFLSTSTMHWLLFTTKSSLTGMTIGIMTFDFLPAVLLASCDWWCSTLIKSFVCFALRSCVKLGDRTISLLLSYSLRSGLKAAGGISLGLVTWWNLAKDLNPSCPALFLAELSYGY